MIDTLSDSELVTNLKSKVKIERQTALEVMNYLKEVQRRRLFSGYGYRSLHAFCLGELGYSDGEASRKIRTLRLVQDLPEAGQMIADGSLNFTNASSLFSHLEKEDRTKPQKRNLLKHIENQPTRKVDRILAEDSSSDVKVPNESKRAIKGNRVSVKFSVEENEYDKLSELMDELGVNSMEELVVKMRKIVSKKSDVKARNFKPSKNPRYISARLKRKVLERDNYKCVFCGSKRDIEIDHIIPFGRGGKSTAKNLRITCKRCNQRSAIEEYGLRYMDKYINKHPREHGKRTKIADTFFQHIDTFKS